jgi:pimeloyl-ACP methyl ester carboxylesterase
MGGIGVTRAHFVGHSMGTIVCQSVAAAQPSLVASLSLFGALAEPAETTRQGLTNRAKLARSGSIADIADQIVANALSAHTRETSPATVAFVRESITRQDPESYARSCEALAKATAIDPRRISAPTLLVTGDADTVNPMSVGQALADRIKGAVFSSIGRCGHWATVESPRESNQKLIDFLRRVDR